MESHTILCVDDDLDVLEALQHLLQQEGRRIIMTTDAREALDIVRLEDIALILVDKQEPEFDSVRILEQVKEISPSTLRLLVSRDTPPETVIEAINRGAISHFIAKPWADPELQLAVKEALERYDLIMEKDYLLDTIAEQNLMLLQMNQHLTQQYEERSEDLTYSQQILAELGLPIIGTDPDGLIVFINLAAQQLFKEEGYNLLQFPIAEVLPLKSSEFVDTHRRQGSLFAVMECKMKERLFRLQSQRLKGQHGVRGYLVSFHEWFPIGGESR